MKIFSWDLLVPREDVLLVPSPLSCLIPQDTNSTVSSVLPRPVGRTGDGPFLKGLDLGVWVGEGVECV